MCVQFAGYTLTTSSDNATIGLDFTFTCVTTETSLIFQKGTTVVCVIIGSKTDGTCKLAGGCITVYAYTCNPTTNTYTVAITGSNLTESLHGTTWKCGDSYGGETSNTTILYVNGELFFFFLLFGYCIVFNMVDLIACLCILIYETLVRKV